MKKINLNYNRVVVYKIPRSATDVPQMFFDFMRIAKA